MGACFSCVHHLFFRDGSGRASGGDGVSQWQRRCRRLVSCCGMCDDLFQTSEEQESSSGPLLQSTEDSSTASYSQNTGADTRQVGLISSSLRHEKVGTNLRQTQIGETHFRSSGGSGLCSGEDLAFECCKIKLYEKDPKSNVRQLAPPSKSGKSEEVTSLLDDEDICPTCLDGYDEENPKIMTKCGHHFHLACILEWMERSSHCPLCDKEMIIIETS